MTKTTLCTKAIIPVAGFGTRRLPITKAIEKCMIPVGNRPIIDYVVQDCIKAGITDIIFVVGEDFEQLKHYYGRNMPLEEYLGKKGRQEQLSDLRALSQGARFHYVIQDTYQPYGTSVPVYLARNFIQPGERFVVGFGDQFLYHENGESELSHMFSDMEQMQTTSGILGVEVPRQEVVKYGIIATEKNQAGVPIFKSFIEKPATPEAAPSTTANASLYVLEEKVFPFIEANVRAKISGEHYLTDALNSYAKAGGEMAVLSAKGEYLDCGTVEGWLQANNRVLTSLT